MAFKKFQMSYTSYKSKIYIGNTHNTLYVTWLQGLTSSLWYLALFLYDFAYNYS